HTETAAPSASAVGVFDQAIADKTDGVVVLRLLDRGVLGVLLVALHSVGPVFAKATAVTSGHSLEVAVIFAAPRVSPAEAGVADHGLAARRDSPRNKLREGQENGIREAHCRLPATNHGRRIGAVHDGPGRR